MYSCVHMSAIKYRQKPNLILIELLKLAKNVYGVCPEQKAGGNLRNTMAKQVDKFDELIVKFGELDKLNNKFDEFEKLLDELNELKDGFDKLKNKFGELKDELDK